ncbi:MAG: DUF748 domain-containing protein [Mariprofundales bacterium]|nr:DUF748 domain-containing protein [Mariprofundales bacterium]
MKGLIWMLLGSLILIGLIIGMLWWQQDRVMDELLAQFAPDLHYDALHLDIAHGQLTLQRVRWKQPGLSINGGTMTMDIDSAALAQQQLKIIRVLFEHGEISLTPQRLDLATNSAAPSFDQIALPQRLELKNIVLTVHAPWAKGITPLHLDLVAKPLPDGWKIQVTTPLEGGEAQIIATISTKSAHGKLVLRSANLSTLTQNLAKVLASKSPIAIRGGVVSATLDWHAPFAHPDHFSAHGTIRLDRMRLIDPWQHHQQTLRRATAKLTWDGAKMRLHITDLALVAPNLTWRSALFLPATKPKHAQKRHHKPANTATSASASPSWQIDQLQIHQGEIHLTLDTPAGIMQLPSHIHNAALHQISSTQWWPAQTDLTAKVAGGTVTLAMRSHQVKLQLQQLHFSELEPLMVSMLGLRTPSGTANISLRGSLGKHLKLRLNFLFHGLVISPRIPVPGVDRTIPFPLALRALTDETDTTRFPLAIHGTWNAPKLDASHATSLVKQHPFRSGLDGGIRWLAVDFLAGKNRLTPAGITQLAHLKENLFQHPVAKLELRGCVAPASTTTDRRKLAAARAKYLKKVLRQGKTSDLRITVVYPQLTDPSPDIDGKKDRVELAIYPLVTK